MEELTITSKEAVTAAGELTIDGTSDTYNFNFDSVPKIIKKKNINLAMTGTKRRADNHSITTTFIES